MEGNPKQIISLLIKLISSLILSLRAHGYAALNVAIHLVSLDFLNCVHLEYIAPLSVLLVPPIFSVI